MRVSPRLLSRLSMGLAIGAALVLSASTVAVADTELGHTGLVGRHKLKDSADKAGVKCYYQTFDGQDGPASIHVRIPRVFARDRTIGLDSQKVGWRVIVQQSSDFVNWTLLFHSSVQKRLATDQSVAPFHNRDFNLPDRHFIRVRIKMYWYRPGSSTVVQGTARHAVDFYDRYLDSTFEDQIGPNGYCPDDLTDPPMST